MSKQHPIELFMPPNTLKAKVGGAGTGLDMAAITRAEAAVDTLKADFNDWVGSDVAALGGARDSFAANPRRKPQARCSVPATTSRARPRRSTSR